MKNRPLLIKILAILHFFQPIINIVYLKLTTEYEWSMIISNLLSLDGIKNNFDFWVLFPIGGAALLIVKNWSFFIFIAVQLYSIYLHIFYEKYTWPYVSEKPLFYSIVLLVCNVIFIAYAFLPDIRELFFDRTKRWWETSKRYFVNTPCKMTVISKGTIFDSTIINISRTGAFLESSIDLDKGEVVSIDFNFKLQKYSLSAKLVSNHTINDIKGMGVKFIVDKFHANEKQAIKKLMREVVKSNSPISSR